MKSSLSSPFIYFLLNWILQLYAFDSAFVQIKLFAFNFIHLKIKMSFKKLFFAFKSKTKICFRVFLVLYLIMVDYIHIYVIFITYIIFITMSQIWKKIPFWFWLFSLLPYKKCNLAAASHAPRRLAGMKIRKIILSYCAQWCSSS